MIPESEAHSFLIYRNMCYFIVPYCGMFGIFGIFEELITVNKLGLIHGYYPDLFMIIQYFNRILKCIYVLFWCPPLIILKKWYATLFV